MDILTSSSLSRPTNHVISDTTVPMLLYSDSAELLDMVVCFFDFQVTKDLPRDTDLLVCVQNTKVNISVTPVRKVESCAKTIVNSACRGQRYVTVPAWFRVTYLWKVFAPEVLECMLRLIYLTGPGTSPKDALSKKVADYTGARNVLYPETMRTAEIKTD